MTKMSGYEVTRMQIKRIEKEIRDTPYHKGTEHHIGILRARLSRLNESLDTPSQRGGGGGYSVKKQGDATVVLIGPPSAGKSTLINLLTNAQSKVAPYAFTTVSVIPGMMEYKSARIQILDVPGLIEGAEEGKGRGREVLSVARGADLLIIMSDPKRTKTIENIKEALERNGIRINKTPPNVDVEKKMGGGVIIHSNLKQELAPETIKEIAGEYGYKNAEVTIKEKLSLERAIDSFSTNRVYVPALYVLNKADTAKKRSNEYIYISAQNEMGIQSLLEAIWQKLNFIRVYLVKRDQEPNYDNPMIMRAGQTLKDVAEKIGTDFAQNHSKAKIWNSGSKFPGQEVSITAQVVEGMQVRFLA